MTESKPILIVGGHFDLHHWIGDYLVAGAIIPEEQLEYLRELDRIDQVQTCCADVETGRVSKIFLPKLPDIEQPSIEKPRISKHRQARQERFRARHK